MKKVELKKRSLTSNLFKQPCRQALPNMIATNLPRKCKTIGPVVSEEMFENVDGQTMDEWRTPVIGILIAHLGALGSGELIIDSFRRMQGGVKVIVQVSPVSTRRVISVLNFFFFFKIFFSSFQTAVY